MDIVFSGVPFWLAVIIGIGTVAIALWFPYRIEQLRCRRLPAASKANYRPAAVIMALKGIDPDLRESLQAVLRQDHPDLEFVFAVEARNDPAYPLIEDVIAEEHRRHPELKAQLVVAGIETVRAQKITNVLAAIDRVAEDVEQLVFLDSDVRPASGYVRYLLQPLQDDRQYGATTGYRWYHPEPASFAGLLCSAWNAGVFPVLAHPKLCFTWAGSMAIRKSLFENGVRAAWQHAVSDSMTLTQVVKDHGLLIRYVPHCIAVTKEDPNLSHVVEFTTRQMLMTRVYNPLVWLVTTLAQGLVAGLLIYSFLSLLMWLFVGGDRYLAGAGGLFLLLPLGLSTMWMVSYGAQWISGAEESVRQRRWLYALIAPFAALLSTYNSICNLITRKIVWRGIEYELISPQKTIVRRPD